MQEKELQDIIVRHVQLKMKKELGYEEIGVPGRDDLDDDTDGVGLGLRVTVRVRVKVKVKVRVRVKVKG